MKEHSSLTFEQLPEAVFQIMQDVAEIKKILLNNFHIGDTNENLQTLEKDILSVIDVAEKLGMTISGVYNLTHLRQIPYFKRGGRIYFDAKEINEWIRSDRRKTVKQLQEEANIIVRKK